jgi:nucleoid-associated protein EbfC
MFEDIFGNMQKQQADVAQRLATITVEAEAGFGAVKVTTTGDGSVKDVKIDPTKISLNDVEKLEDLLVTALNEALEKGRKKAEEETQQLINNMIPPGMEGLFGK